MRETKPEKECFAFNTSLIIIPILVLMCIFITTVCFICAARNENVESNVLIAVIFLLFGVFMIVLFPFSAYGYLFSEEGVTILYVQRERNITIPWKRVKTVTRRGLLISRRYPRYVLTLYPDSDPNLYPNQRKWGSGPTVEIFRTPRVKRLMKRFYRGEIL